MAWNAERVKSISMIGALVVMKMKKHPGVRFDRVANTANIRHVLTAANFQIQMIVKNSTISFQRYLDIYFSLTEQLLYSTD